MTAAGESSSGSGTNNTSIVVAKSNCNDLFLKLKYEIIKAAENEPKRGVRKVAGSECFSTKMSQKNHESKFSDLNEAFMLSSV